MQRKNFNLVDEENMGKEKVQDFLNENPNTNIVIATKAINGFFIGLMNNNKGKTFKVFINEKTGKRAFGDQRFDEAKPFDDRGRAEIIHHGKKGIITKTGSIIYSKKEKPKKKDKKSFFSRRAFSG